MGGEARGLESSGACCWSLLYPSDQFAARALHNVQHLVYVPRTRRDDQALHPQSCVLTCKVEVELSLGGNADFDLVEAAAMFVAGGANSADTVHGGFEIKAVAEPSVTQARRTAECVGGFSTEDYWRI